MGKIEHNHYAFNRLSPFNERVMKVKKIRTKIKELRTCIAPVILVESFWKNMTLKQLSGAFNSARSQVFPDFIEEAAPPDNGLWSRFTSLLLAGLSKALMLPYRLVGMRNDVDS